MKDNRKNERTNTKTSLHTPDTTLQQPVPSKPCAGTQREPKEEWVCTVTLPSPGRGKLATKTKRNCKWARGVPPRASTSAKREGGGSRCGHKRLSESRACQTLAHIKLCAAELNTVALSLPSVQLSCPAFLMQSRRGNKKRKKKKKTKQAGLQFCQRLHYYTRARSPCVPSLPTRRQMICTCGNSTSAPAPLTLGRWQPLLWFGRGGGAGTSIACLVNRLSRLACLPYARLGARPALHRGSQ